MSAARLAIIGGGPSGLSILNAFRHAEENGQTVPEIVCFEKQSDVGGLWNYTWRTGLDSYGEPVPNSMYRHLWSNAPKECLELADYNFMEHFQKPIPSFPPRPILRSYIMGRAQKSNVLPFVRLNTVVRHVQLIENGRQFQITSFDHVNKKSSTEVFDYVVVATGHFSYPSMPSHLGLDSFPGRIMHAHDFRDAREFSGKRVLVVGSSYSAEDIALQCHKFGAERITCCYKQKPMGFNWPANIEELPLLTKVDGNTVHFNDDITRDVDAIIFCTGYQHIFPFLPDDYHLANGNIPYPDKLYKGIFWQSNPRLMYIGMQNQCYSFPLFDAQAWYLRDFVLGSIILPSADEQAEEIKKWYQTGMAIASTKEFIDYQTAYLKDLLEATDYPTYDVDTMRQYFHDWTDHKYENIMTYREKSFTSVITGHAAPAHHTKWLEAKDDSPEAFLSTDHTSS